MGLLVQLRAAELKLESLYTHNANGNVLHYDWKHLIEERASLPQGEPAARQPHTATGRQLARGDRPTQPQLAASIERQLRPKPGLKRLLERRAVDEWK